MLFGFFFSWLLFDQQKERKRAQSHSATENKYAHGDDKEEEEKNKCVLDYVRPARLTSIQHRFMAQHISTALSIYKNTLYYSSHVRIMVCTLYRSYIVSTIYIL